MDRLPRRLRVVPIIEAFAEVRFEATSLTSGQILVGALYQQLNNCFTHTEPLPASEIPAQIRRADQNLRYAPTFRLVGPEMTVLVGDQTLAVGVGESSYPGWLAFRSLIQDVWEKAATSPFVGLVERMSLKYINLIAAPLGTDHLSLTNLALSANGRTITDEPTTFRTEVTRGPVVSVLQIASQATVSMPEKPPRHGLVIDIDVIHTGPIPGFWDRSLELLELVHEAEKEFFFSTLSPETLQRHQPEY